MFDKAQIKEWVTAFLDGTDRFLVDVLIKNNDTIMVFLDSDTQLTIEHCVEVSRMLEQKLDRDIQDYELRVSSAGVDHPLVFERQYRKNINRTVKLQLTDGSEITGIISDADDKGITLVPVLSKKRSKIKQNQFAEARQIAFETIKEAKVQISFK